MCNCKTDITYSENSFSAMSSQSVEPPREVVTELEGKKVKLRLRPKNNG